MENTYRFDPRQSKFTVQAFATGLLTTLALNPKFAVREFSGTICFAESKIQEMTLELAIRADSLELLDHVSAADLREIEEKMKKDVLETATHPEIRYRSVEASAGPTTPGEFQARIEGRLTLRGVTQAHRIVAKLRIFGDGVRLSGEFPLHLSDYRIKPVTALRGAVKLKDELMLSFDLLAVPESS